VAAALGVDVGRLVAINSSVYPGLRPDVPLMEGTLLKLPARHGSGGGRDLRIFVRVAEPGGFRTVAMTVCTAVYTCV
jgi:hypothetical protein